jgi:hypothetical protein
MLTTTTTNARTIPHAAFRLDTSLRKLENFPPPIPSLTQAKRFTGIARLQFITSGISIPEQPFTFLVSPDEKQIRMESSPTQDWPKITLQCELDAAGIYQITILDAEPIWPTTAALIKHTRLSWALFTSNKCLFDFGSGIVFSLNATTRDSYLAATSLQQINELAALARKVSFLEKVFQRTFKWPSELSEKNLSTIDFLFQGITEGRCNQRAAWFDAPIDPSGVDLRQPPWMGIGRIKTLPFDWKASLFGTDLEVGLVWVEAAHAGIGSLKALRQFRRGATEPVQTRLAVLDHQVTFHFERYGSSFHQAIESELKSYLNELAQEEPEELYELTREPLVAYVDFDEANHLATGWTQIHDLPDRYCSQLPTLDESGEFWRVPLWLTYPSGKGAAVADLFVDVKTGIVTPSIPLSEIRTRGKQLAHQLLHGSETALSPAGD